MVFALSDLTVDERAVLCMIIWLKSIPPPVAITVVKHDAQEPQGLQWGDLGKSQGWKKAAPGL